MSPSDRKVLQTRAEIANADGTGSPATASKVNGAERLTPGIIHFDATQDRRDRLRSQANPVAPPGKSIADMTTPAQPASMTPEPSAPPAPSPISAPAADEWWQRVMRDFPDTDGHQEASDATTSTTEVPVANTVESGQDSLIDSSSKTAGRSELQSFLINFVVEQTGYPEEIVAMDADLEADLGIDSIKKAQMFGEIGDFYGIAPDENQSLDDFLTLDDVLEYLTRSVPANPTSNSSPAPQAPTPAVELGGATYESSYSGNGKAAASAATTPPPAVSPKVSAQELQTFLINFVVEQTGYPEEIVEMQADLEADLGIDSIKKAQMFGEIGEHFGLQPDENLSLDEFTTLTAVLEYLQTKLS